MMNKSNASWTKSALKAVAFPLVMGTLVGCGGGADRAGSLTDLGTAQSLDLGAVTRAANDPGVVAPMLGAASDNVGTYLLTIQGGKVLGTNLSSLKVQPGSKLSIQADPAPAGKVFQSWTSSTALASSTSSTTSLVMPSAAVTISAVYVAGGPSPSPSPTPSTSFGSYNPAAVTPPVTSHPRLWITQNDLPTLRGRASSSNPVYAALTTSLNQCISDYNTRYFPNGVANPSYPDVGDTQGYSGLVSEQHALVFALHSLIDPNPANRILHAQRARNLIMVVMNEAAKGPLAGAPFRDPQFILFNRANFSAEAWPLAVDWIYSAVDAKGNPILTSQDKATIRKVFMQWANQCLNAHTTSGDSPQPTQVVNSSLLLPGGKANRWAANNYFNKHACLLTMMSLVLDPADDLAIDPTKPASSLGNSLRSYLNNATGAWLLQQYTMFGDASDIRTRLNLPAGAVVGQASGGLPIEGWLYGHSNAYILGELLALKTAGYANTTLCGPQASLATGAPVWGRVLDGMLASLVPTAQVVSSMSYLGPIFQMTGYGDILRTWITPDFSQTASLMQLLDQQNGSTSRLNAQRWFALNAVEGGSAALSSRITSTAYGVQDGILYFLTLDPAAAAPTDPRPAMPTAFNDTAQGRYVEHSDWSAGAALLTFACGFKSIDHQQGDANKLELYRKGEWLTKGLNNYDTVFNAQTTDFQNTLSLQNRCTNGTPTNLAGFEQPIWARGGQYLYDFGGDPAAYQVDTQASYTYTYGDATALYNRPSQWTAANDASDITHASRSLLWIKPDKTIVYDRATSKSTGLFKRFNLTLNGAPTVATTAAGSQATTTTPKGQHLFVTSLLPAGGKMTSAALPGTLAQAALEPSTHRLVVDAPTTTPDVRFLHVLEGADASQATSTAATLVTSSSGTAFDGAVVGSSVVMFNRVATAAVPSVTYSVPTTVTKHYVTGLAPSTGYTITMNLSGGQVNVTITAGGSTTTDAGGVLTF